MKAYRVKVIGRVQGVAFRYYTKKKADQLSLEGNVRNKHDGSVVIYVKGESDGLGEFMEWLKTGSPASRVDSIQKDDYDPEFIKESGFVIRR